MHLSPNYYALVILAVNREPAYNKYVQMNMKTNRVISQKQFEDIQDNI